MLRGRLPDGLGKRLKEHGFPGAQQVSQAEVQQAVQRFAGRFVDQITQAAEQLAVGGDSQHIERVLRRTLLYASNAFEIATGPLPELNFLDMLVFTSLVRDAFARHWQPRVFDARGTAMLDALAGTEADAWALAERYLLPRQREELRERIQNWQAAHPAQYRVEAVRLSDFPELASVGDRKSDTGTLLGDLRGATRTADQAVLLGDRALFWAQRAPTLIRLQVRLGALELTGDLTGPLGESQQLIGRCGELAREAQALGPVLTQGTQLTQQLAHLSAQAQDLLGTAQTLAAPLLAERPQPDGSTLTALEEAGRTYADLVTDLQAVLERVPDPRELGALMARSDALARRIFAYASLAAIGSIAAFWLGYYLVHR